RMPAVATGAAGAMVRSQAASVARRRGCPTWANLTIPNSLMRETAAHRGVSDWMLPFRGLEQRITPAHPLAAGGEAAAAGVSFAHHDRSFHTELRTPQRGAAIPAWHNASASRCPDCSLHHIPDRGSRRLALRSRFRERTGNGYYQCSR